MDRVVTAMPKSLTKCDTDLHAPVFVTLFLQNCRPHSMDEKQIPPKWLPGISWAPVTEASRLCNKVKFKMHKILTFLKYCLKFYMLILLDAHTCISNIHRRQRQGDQEVSLNYIVSSRTAWVI